MSKQNVYLESKPRYEILDGLRGVASLMVIIFHLGETYCKPGAQQWINHGYLAVDFFFVLSGFVIGYAYDDRWGKMSLGGFFKRRLTRLHPMVVIANIIGTCLFFFGASYFTASLEIPFWKFGLCFIMGMFIIPCGRGLDIRGWNEMNSFNGPIWTLTFEYIGNILYAFVFRHLPTIVLCILCAGTAIFTLDFTLGWDMFGMLPVKEYINEAGELMTWGGPQYHVKGGWSLDPAQIYLGFTRLLYPFLCGLIISRILPKRRTADNPSGSPIRLKGGFIWTSLILVTILSIPCIGGTDGVANGAYQAIMILLVFPVLVLMGAGSTIKSPALAKVCKFLGDISYPIYITHYPLIYLHMGFVAEHPVGSIPTWMHVASGVGVFFTAVILAWGVFKAYDEPTRKWLTDHWLKGEQKLPMWLKITTGVLVVAAIALIVFKP